MQRDTDQEGGEIGVQQIWEIFADEYLVDRQAFGEIKVDRYSMATIDGKVELDITVFSGGNSRSLTGVGNGPIDAYVQALKSLGIKVRVLDYQEHALTSGGDAQAAAYVECEVDGTTLWGVGIDTNIVDGSIKALTSAVNRAQ